MRVLDVVELGGMHVENGTGERIQDLNVVPMSMRQDDRVDISRSEATTVEGIDERSDPARAARVDQDPPGLSC